jgi:hypothetical protein
LWGDLYNYPLSRLEGGHPFVFHDMVSTAIETTVLCEVVELRARAVEPDGDKMPAIVFGVAIGLAGSVPAKRPRAASPS